MTAPRVRFAPSPTGFLHIGGARTALFNWLFARHEGGRFFLRIEDTDQDRSTEVAAHAIISGLHWLGLDWDPWEGSSIVRQADRRTYYRNAVETLLQKGHAYRCYCTPEALEAQRAQALQAGKPPRYDGRCRHLTSPKAEKSAIRFMAPSDGEIVVDDLVKGRVVFDSSVMDDLIILRSNGTPTYNLCAVVDDTAMQITHVIRGDDHLNNTPRQIQIYQALGYPAPQFGHIPMILGTDRQRLSKRHGAISVSSYRDDGFLPEAMVNYLARLGWSHKDQEIFSVSELVEHFSLERIGASAAVFNPEKLLWLNAHYIRTGNPKRIAELLVPHLSTPPSADPPLEPVVVALQERSRTLTEMAASAAYFWADDIVYDDAALALLIPQNLPVLQKVCAVLRPMTFEHDALAEAFKVLCAELDLKLAKVAQPVRAAITGKTVSPGLFDVLVLLGKERALTRLDGQIARLSNMKADKRPYDASGLERTGDP